MPRKNLLEIWWRSLMLSDPILGFHTSAQKPKTAACRFLASTSRLQKYVHRMPAYVGSQEICPCLNTPLFLLLSVLTGAWGHSKVLNAGEGPPTLQSAVIPAWNYAPQLLRKVTPTFSPIVNAARKWKSTKTIIPNVQITMRTQVTPMVSNYGKLLTKWHVSISKHHVNAWFMYVWVKYFFVANCNRI